MLWPNIDSSLPNTRNEDDVSLETQDLCFYILIFMEEPRHLLFNPIIISNIFKFKKMSNWLSQKGLILGQNGRYFLCVKSSSGSKLFFWGGPTIFAPFDIVVQGHFQEVSVILASSKSNLCAFLIAVSSLRGGMAPYTLLLRSATDFILLLFLQSTVL